MLGPSAPAPATMSPATSSAPAIAESCASRICQKRVGPSSGPSAACSPGSSPLLVIGAAGITHRSRPLLLIAVYMAFPHCSEA